MTRNEIIENVSDRLFDANPALDFDDCDRIAAVGVAKAGLNEDAAFEAAMTTARAESAGLSSDDMLQLHKDALVDNRIFNAKAKREEHLAWLRTAEGQAAQKAEMAKWNKIADNLLRGDYDAAAAEALTA